MGIISLEQTDHLYWLGRYSERVYSSIRLFSRRFDSMIDSCPALYVDCCRELEIPNRYSSNEDFARHFCADEDDPNSIVSNLVRAYDNAIVMREEIGSESLCYIQLALYEMRKTRETQAPLIELQRVADNILAFWGIIDDQMDGEYARNIVKIGKRVERIDLYARLKMPADDLRREVHRLNGRIDRTGLRYSAEGLKKLNELVELSPPDYYNIVIEAESLIGESTK